MFLGVVEQPNMNNLSNEQLNEVSDLCELLLDTDWRERVQKSVVFSRVAEFLWEGQQREVEEHRIKVLQKIHDQKTRNLQVPLQPGQVNNICWVVTCYNELEFVDQAVSSIRRNDAGTILIINDGGSTDGLEDIASRNRATFLNSARFKTAPSGPTWWKRFFFRGLRSNADFIVKVDPDAYMHRPLTKSLSGLNLFGTTTDYKKRDPFSVQGGVQGFSKSYAQKILLSGLLDVFWGYGVRPDGVWGTDLFIKRVNRALFQFGEEWLEVRSVYSENEGTPANQARNYALTHPVPIFSSGEKFISHEHVARASICRQCDQLDLGSWTCKKSGEYVYPKTKLQQEACPVGKW